MPASHFYMPYSLPILKRRLEPDHAISGTSSPTPIAAARALADQGFNFRMRAASRAIPSGIRSVEIAE